MTLNEKKIIITGNPNKGLAKSLFSLYPNACFISRVTGYDLTQLKKQEEFAALAKNYDIIILSAALWKFNQTVLLDEVYKQCCSNNKIPYIICIGSTTDRVKNGKVWLYNSEKKALRDYSNTLALAGVWGNGPKISYISFGTLSNNQEKHPDRKCLNIDDAALYIKWLIDQPRHVNINEVSIDPMQNNYWY